SKPWLGYKTKRMKFSLIVFCSLILASTISAQKEKVKIKNKDNNKQYARDNKQDASRIMPGAERINVYLPMIKGRRVGIFANQTSTVGSAHLVDTLRNLGVDIKVIFGPEHGFRGNASAGEKVGNYVDEKTGIPI